MIYALFELPTKKKKNNNFPITTIALVVLYRLCISLVMVRIFLSLVII